MLSERELALMRDDGAKSLPDTCDILEPTESSDLAGSYARSWAVSASAVPCRLSPTSLGGRDAEAVHSGRLTAVTDWTLTLAWDVPVSSVARVVCNGRTFEVSSDDEDRSWHLLNRIRLAEVV